MEHTNIFMAAKAAVAVFFGAFSAAFGWIGCMIAAWVACMVIDWISGSAAAAAKGEWSSAVARAGILHKAGMLLVVIVAGIADCVLYIVVEYMPGLSIEYTNLILPMVLAWYIFTELGSIAENATDMGAPVPKQLKKWLAIAKNAAENAGNSEDEGPDE